MPNPPSLNTIRANATSFASRWADESHERAESQTFWNEFLAIFGIDRRRVATFERRAERATTGGLGAIDLFWPQTLIAEQKSLGRDLDAAEDQAMDYLDAIPDHEMPRMVIVSDFARMRLRDLDTDNQPHTFALADLPREIDRLTWLAGYNQRQFSEGEEAQANIAAAKLMANLYEHLAEAGYPDHDASVLLVRILFLLFGDDTGMWERGLFLEFLETRTSSDGSNLGAQLLMLFETALDTPESERPAALDELAARFPYVNGGLFHGHLRFPAFNQDTRDQLLHCAAFDWSRISPAIFGSLFQSVKSREARRELGEHYTTEQNIMKVIGPLFLDDLRAQFEAARDSVQKLRNLRNRLGALRFLDPACGCGNFLVIAYRELRALELDILRRIRDLTGDRQLDIIDATMDLRVRLDQFHGIEVEEWPARIAETAMFLVDHQANIALGQEFGQHPDRLPIEVAADIRVGNALELDWASVLPPSDNVVVLGNPPFIGMARLSAAQRADNRRAFAQVTAAGLRTGRLDYVACWYALALRYIAGTKARVGFVSTNSITQGEQARTMLPLLERHGVKIDFAHRTFKWSSEAPGAAAVHCVIVGFSVGGVAQRKRLFDYPSITAQPVETSARNINFYLVDADDIAPAKRFEPLLAGLPNATQGNKPVDGGFLIVSAEDHDTVAADPLAGRYLRPFRQAREMLHDEPRWCLWLVGAAPSDIHGSPELRRRLAAVAAARRESPTATVRDAADTPALFTQIRQPASRYFALPEVSSEARDYIPGRFYEPEVIAGNKLIVWPDAPVWLAGYLQSAAFTAWVKTYAGRLESRISISPGLTYFTYPFILPNEAQTALLGDAAGAMFAARDAHSGAALADLYDPLAMPADLRRAHRELDAVVDGLHGLRRPTESERLRALLERYLRLTSEGQLPVATTTPTRRRRAAR